MQALRHTEEANVELSGAKRWSRAAFGRSCALESTESDNVELSGAKRWSRVPFGRSRALESTASGTMLSARRSRSFASGSRRARPLLRREERRRTTLAFSAQP
ncbi:unnamed protein product [Coccothraustes coccothraustes]